MTNPGVPDRFSLLFILLNTSRGVPPILPFPAITENVVTNPGVPNRIILYLYEMFFRCLLTLQWPSSQKLKYAVIFRLRFGQAYVPSPKCSLKFEVKLIVACPAW
jgi:hypothetical protein